MSTGPDSCRIDVWLWRARFFKTRAIAANVVGQGGVRLMRGLMRGNIDKPSRQVQVGDDLAFTQGSTRITLRVEALGERRGPACEARTLFSLMNSERPTIQESNLERDARTHGWTRGPLGASAQTKNDINWQDRKGR